MKRKGVSIWRKLHYFFSMWGHVLWIEDQIKKVDEAIEILKRMEKKKNE